MIGHNKAAILEALIKEIEGESEQTLSAAKDARRCAIEAPGAMQSRHDTSKMEYGALSDALSKRMEEKDLAVALLRKFQPLPVYNNVSIGALARVEMFGASGYDDYFVLPAGGGKILTMPEGELTIITRESPIFRAMEGLSAGQRFNFGIQNRMRSYSVMDVA